MRYTVGQVSTFAGISIRALHHYDQIGLLNPSGHTQAGYRTYTDADVAALQQVMLYRELGFSLAEIRRIMQSPDFDRRKALVAQRKMLFEKIARLNAVIGLVDKTLECMKKGKQMNHKDMFEGFDPALYEQEAQNRWGAAEAYKQSSARTKRYTKNDWKAIQAEGDAITEAFAEAFRAGKKADGPRAMELAERHRRHIDRWFYACPPTMHAGLGEMYVSDPRFAQSYDQKAPGLAGYVRDAIRANARLAETNG